VISGSRLPDETYSERIQSAFPFADPPGLYSTLTYDAVSLLAQVAGRAANRESISEALGQVHYSGINGNIRFVDGYWADMPLNRYAYSQSGELQAEP
jgi:ABC-type branched-subunit amino acid transport system substrate-binding protein